MTQRPRIPSGALALGASVLTLCSCSLPQPTMGGVGGSGGVAGTDSGAGLGSFSTYRVAYLVQCRGCLVYYTGAEDEAVEVDGTWTETVRVRSDVSPSVFLTANPEADLGYVTRAQIEIEGQVVAEERRAAGSLTGEVTLMAPLPPR